MKFLARISLILLACIVAACSKSDFVLSFQLPEDISANYSVTYYAAAGDGGLTVQAVAAVQAGKCEMKGVTKSATLLFIYEKTRDIPLVVFADAGDKIELTGDSKQPLEWTVSGNQTNLMLSQWRKQYADTLKRKKPEEINDAVANFVLENPDEPAATILLMNYYDRRINERAYADLFATLQGKARRRSLIELIGRSDQLSPYIGYPARLESMVMKSAINKSDTIRPDSSGVVLLYFWQNGVTNRSEVFDSIGILRKEFEDSARFLIADVNVDADSTSWRTQLRRDTIKGISRLWVSAGLADRNIMKLKVPSIPYFLVFDSLGNQAYRGTEIKGAMEEYRSLAHMHDSVATTQTKTP